MRICPDCSEGVELDSRFCPHCGVIFFASLPQKEVAETEKGAGEAPARAEPVTADPHPKKKCPECGKQVEKYALSCSFCGLIFYTRPAQPIHDVTRRSVRSKPSKGNWTGFAFLAVIIILTIYYLPQIRWVLEGNLSDEPREVRAVPSGTPEFDLSIDVQGRPSSLTYNEAEFVLGNRDTGSFIRVSRAGDQYLIRQHRVGDISPLAWNGEEFIGSGESGLLQTFKKYFFTTHDPQSLNLRKQFPAPERIGGVAWDGSGYWAASRNENDADRGFIYRLDRNFTLVNKMVAPSSVCRGLVWDGNHLWFLNGYKKNLQVLDVNGIQAKTVDEIEVPLKSPSGIAFDGRAIWIADYSQRRLLRLKTGVTAKWLMRNGAARISAESKKERLNFDEYKGTEILSDDDVQVTSFSALIESKVLYATWDIHIGRKLLRRSNGFAKLTITVDGGTLASPVGKVYDANTERNFQDRLPILSSIEPGTYNIGLFLYIQYIDSDGQGRIMSKSIPPLRVTTGG